MTQRELSRRTGVAQPTIARIERGLVDPRVGTIDRLLAACGACISVEPVPGYGIDRSQMRELLRLSARERVELLRRDASGLARLDRAVGT
ncbi:MAG: helix-turn-helix domain-containing protein [Acidimicrobiales bacterium]|nr:helix-turn-helix domain-containing protein [Acidimicrobiales bacterium]